MYRYLLAYRHDDGAVEGFVGLGPTPETAQHDAIRQILGRLSDPTRLRLFQPTQIIEGDDELTCDEQAAVRRNWNAVKLETRKPTGCR